MKNIELLQGILQTEDLKCEMVGKIRKYQDGSIRIDYQPNATLNFPHHNLFQPFKNEGKDQTRQTVCFWVYQEEAKKGVLRFLFEKNERECCSFSFGLDFTGWRTAWVIYERDMQGSAEVGMDNLRIEFPDTAGTLYLSDVQLDAKIDPRHPTPDYQVPFVNPNIGASGHWMELCLFDRHQKVNAKSQKLKAQQDIDIKELNTIQNRQRNYLLEKYENRKMVLSQTIEKYNSYQIKESDGLLTGCSIDSVYTMEILPEKQRKELLESGVSQDMRKCSALLLDMALLYQTQKEAVMGENYLLLLRHLLQQGLAEGSSLGTTHHYGYVLKELFDSIFLMADYLKTNAETVFHQTRKMMAWITGLGRIYIPEQECSINIDVLNTYSHAMLMVILMEEREQQDELLAKFRDWLNFSIDYAKGLEGTFKPDGSMYHHCNHYPAYGLDGLKSLTPLVYFLAGTKAEISEKSYQIITKAMENMRWYCNLKHWPTALSARHPKTDGEHTHLVSDVYYYMALAEMESGRKPNLGNLYLRLEGELSGESLQEKPEKIREKMEQLLAKGYHAEQTPNGHLTMNLACAGFHRRGEWLAAIRGHNRYLWAHESYVANNLYGRYISYNHLQILGKGSPITLKASGYQAEGFDWNSFSGTTVIELPYEELKSKVYNVDEFSGYEEMLLTDESFAGGLSMGQDGMFAMKLHGHAKYDDSHYANLSTYFFDNYIIRLGSNIESGDTKHRSITTLFQSLTVKDRPFYIGKEAVASEDYFRIYQEKDGVFADAYQNNYWVRGEAKVEIKSSLQKSPAQDTGEIKEGHFTKMLIDHGIAPKQAEYEYVISVGEPVEQFYQKVSEWKENPLYHVLQKDADAHILEYLPKKITAYTLFVPYSSQRADDILLETSQPCLCMIEKGEKQIKLSFSDIDLRFYVGKDTEQYDSEGKHIECSVYSREWMHHPSIGEITRIRLKGLYTLNEPVSQPITLDKATVLEVEQIKETEETILTLWGIQGSELEINLSCQ